MSSLPSLQQIKRDPEMCVRRAVQDNLYPTRVGTIAGDQQIRDDRTVTMWWRQDTGSNRNYMMINTYRGFEAERQFQRNKHRPGFGAHRHAPGETVADIQRLKDKVRRLG